MKKTLLALLLAVGLLLTACGGGSGKTVTYWSMWTEEEPQAQVLREAAQAYTKKTGVRVNLKFVGREGAEQDLPAALENGDGPDLFDGDLDRMNQLFGENLMDLTQLAQQNHLDKRAWNSLLSAAREAGEGTLKTIPYQPTVVAVFYNREIFENAGVTAPPKTWDEFLSVCAAVKEAGYVPLTSDDAYLDCCFGIHLARYLGQAGVTTVAQEHLWAETPAVLAAAKDYEELAAKGYLSPRIGKNQWPAGQNGEFAAGLAAMYVCGSWLPGEVSDITGEDFSWGAFAYPAIEDGTDGTDGTEAAVYGSQAFGIRQGSEVAQEAFDLICFFTQGEWDETLSKACCTIPADKTVSGCPAELADARLVLGKLEKRYVWGAGIQADPDQAALIASGFSALCGGSISAKEFVAMLES